MAAATQRAKPAGSSASMRERMAWPNTGAAPSVEMPTTSGERLTTAPNRKLQKAGLSITLTGTPAPPRGREHAARLGLVRGRADDELGPGEALRIP